MQKVLNLRLKIIIMFICVFLSMQTYSQSDFLSSQKKYKRVRTAISEKDEIVKMNLEYYAIKLDKLRIILVSYKSESILDLYAKNKDDENYQKIKSYAICAQSGTLGPKRRQGDLQVPEGFYHINHFNPVSNFFLSLKVNYPNSSDRIKSTAKKLGGDIFIHGDCVTIGCIPMTDDKIKEIYLYAVYAKNYGQRKIPVYIFPFKMTQKKFEKFSHIYHNNETLLSFWSNIKEGYDIFIENEKEIKYSVDKKGNYLIIK